ncbi:alpha/beta hydrolase [Nocardioides acrostichi]|uniref:Alpha/beta hydrolase n=1 Tax=Nocardioides acrostichi TaxID=2784339 RepID=A0A930Y7K5_9ACTN|nr:alpha/beta hydrolase [Nocardioides acrostichi]MBF4162127.1 alpha/beta hydrolase [Nocardioides acrostichi]
MSFLRRRAVTAALTANALHPLPGYGPAVPSFFAGWLTDELAPHWLASTVLDTGVQLARGKRDPLALGLAVASVAGLGYLIDQSGRVREEVETALTESIGADYAEQLDAAPTPAELAVPWRKLVNPFRMRDAGVRVEKDIAYDDTTGKRGLLDIYLPAAGSVERAPVLLQVHGGAWTVGSKEEQGIPLMHRLASKGWVCVAINYRLSPRATWPEHVVDVKKAIAWIKQNIAAYGGDADYLAITGGSAGGHLASLAALTPHVKEWQPGFEDADTSVDVAVPVYGVYDFAGVQGTKASTQLRDRFLAKRVMKTTFAARPEVFEQASPLLQVTAEAPDFFVLHGRYDTLVPVAQARAFVEALRSVSTATVAYAELPGAQHAFDIFFSIRSSHTLNAVDRFLHWHWNRHTRGVDVAAG